MRLKTYVESCKKFAHDTKDWAELDNTKNYTTPGNKKGWAELEKGQRYIVTKEGKEIPIGLEKGIDVSWAFHKSAEEVEAEAGQKFVSSLVMALFEAGEPLYSDELMDVTDLYQ